MLSHLLDGLAGAALADIPAEWRRPPAPAVAALDDYVHTLADADAAADDDPPLAPATVDALFAAGLFSLTVPQDCGGMEADLREFVRVMASVGALGPAYAMTAVPHLCVSVKAVARFAPAPLRQRLLGGIGAARRLLAFAITEDRGSDVAALATSLRPDADGILRLNGRKQWITNLARASHVVVVALCPSLHRAPNAATLILLPLDAPGVSVAPAWRKLTANGSDTADLFFDDVAVAPEWLLGTPGQALGDFAEMVLPGRLGAAAAAIGLARRSLTTVAAERPACLAAHLRASLAAQLDVLDAAVSIAASAGDAGHPEFPHLVAFAKHLAGSGSQSLVDTLAAACRGGPIPAALTSARRALGLFRLLKGPGEIIVFQAISALSARPAEPAAESPPVPATPLAAHCRRLARLSRATAAAERRQLPLMLLADALTAVFAETAATALAATLAPERAAAAAAWARTRAERALERSETLIDRWPADGIDTAYICLRAAVERDPFSPLQPSGPQPAPLFHPFVMSDY
jgi:alkylation response protein AidB-like acyl-CoA dehydrogenase